MLGHLLVGYLRLQGHHVSTISGRFSTSTAAHFVAAITDTRPDWCINAIGAKATGETTLSVLTDANVHLPEACANLLPASIGFIHASSDAVFNALQPERRIEEAPDATDPYGRSKASGEAKVRGDRRVIVRCSFVGPDRTSPPRTLLSWLLAAEGSVIGYTNHFWNGITSLQWSKMALQIALEGGQEPLVQLGTLPPVSKYELLCEIASVWQSKIQIDPSDAETPVLRTLLPSCAAPSLREQLRELKEMQCSLARFAQ